jgi:anthranilate phosphoribosyltransferase
LIRERISGMDSGTDLTYEQMSGVINGMLRGETGDEENAAFLSSLTAKGETDDELLCMLDAMRRFSPGIDLAGADDLIDMCGTGGDGMRTFNISTSASFVVAAAGVPVAKHGNRSSSGPSGSADIFEYIGCDLGAGPETIRSMLRDCNICFLFAQKFHPAMRHVAAARRRIGHRTAFNILGPLSNPAGVRNQLVGVSSADLLRRIPRLLERRGSRRVMAVMAENGMDELSTASKGRACMLRGGAVTEETVDPTGLGLAESTIGEITVRSGKEAAETFVRSLRGTAGRAVVETAALNAAAGLVVGGAAETVGDAVGTALEAIRRGERRVPLQPDCQGRETACCAARPATRRTPRSSPA